MIEWIKQPSTTPLFPSLSLEVALLLITLRLSQTRGVIRLFLVDSGEPPPHKRKAQETEGVFRATGKFFFLVSFYYGLFTSRLV